MDELILFLQTTATPSTLWNLTSHPAKLIQHEGTFDLSDYWKILQETHLRKNGLKFVKISDNLYCCVITSATTRLILGPVDITSATPTSDSLGRLQASTLLGNYSYREIRETRFWKQVAYVAQLLQISLNNQQIETAWQHPQNSAAFTDSFIRINYDDVGHHVNYRYERAIQHAIATGNVNALNHILQQTLASGRIGNLAPGDDLRSMKNWGIISVSVNLRAVFQVNLDYEVAYSLNDYYVQQIETATSTSKIIAIVQEANLDFTLRCRKIVSTHMTTPIEATFWTLMHHPDAPLITNDLAQSVDLSPAYLGRLFKQEVGLTINQCYRLIQISQIIEDLMTITPTPSLIDLTTQYHFSDQAHLSRTFKHWTNLTPKEFMQNTSQLANWNLYDYIFQD